MNTIGYLKHIVDSYIFDCEIRENHQCGLPEQNIEQIHLALDCKWPRAVLIGTQIE